MIQLSGVQTSGKNHTGKMAEKEGEPTAAAFDMLLQHIGQQEETDTELLGVGNPLAQTPFLQQYPLMGPILQQMGNGEKPSLVQAQVEHPLPKQIIDDLVLQSIAKNQVSSDGHTREMQPDIAAVLQKIVTEDRPGDAASFSKDSSPKESPNASQTTRNSPADAFTMINSTPSNQPIMSSDKAVPAPTVRAAQFDQDITMFLHSSINVSGLEDGMEAAFTLAPKHLGKVDVKVIIQDGQVTAEFLTSTPLGKDILETHVQTLRSALETQGLQVGKIEISQQMQPQSPTNSNFMGAFSQQGDSQGKQGQPESRRRSEHGQLHNQDEYSDYKIETEWVSKINTTA